MRINGSMIHAKCGGLGVLKDINGDYDVCVECMGTGIVEGVVELDEEGTISALYIQ